MLSSKVLKAVVILLTITSVKYYFYAGVQVEKRRDVIGRMTEFLAALRQEPAPVRDPCIRKNSVAFLKTHKTGGSTVQNILMRYGMKRNLNFVLPSVGNYLGYSNSGRRFDKKYIDSKLWRQIGHFDVLCHHCRFDYERIRATMKPGTTFVTILREPSELFESLYVYVHLQKRFNATLDEFVFDERKIAQLANKRLHSLVGFNQTSYDLGFDDNSGDVVVKLEEWFDHVMIMELFDESLILLKEKMCWSTEDVVYFKKNARSEETKRKLRPKIVDRLNELNSGDLEIYRHFKSKLMKEIDEFGSTRMRRELDELRRSNDAWMRACVRNRRNNSQIVDKSRKGYFGSAIGYEIREDSRNNDTCNHLTLPELVFTDQLRKRQLKRVFA